MKSKRNLNLEFLGAAMSDIIRKMQEQDAAEPEAQRKAMQAQHEIVAERQRHESVIEKARNLIIEFASYARTYAPGVPVYQGNYTWGNSGSSVFGSRKRNYKISHYTKLSEGWQVQEGVIHSESPERGEVYSYVLVPPLFVTDDGRLFQGVPVMARPETYPARRRIAGHRTIGLDSDIFYVVRTRTHNEEPSFEIDLPSELLTPDLLAFGLRQLRDKGRLWTPGIRFV